MAKATTKKAERTWIVVADGGHARILESGHRHSGVTVRLDVTSDDLTSDLRYLLR